MIKSKKADIAITILVVAVVILCTVALFSFYMVNKKRLGGGINSFSYLQEIYGIAESVEYSGEELYGGYERVIINNGEIKKQFFKGDLNITYNFKP